MLKYAELRETRKFDELYVLAVVSNPERYKSRYDLYQKFEQHVLDSGAKLHVVEMAFGQRPHVVTTADNPTHIQLRSSEELWHKENMVNIGVTRLPPTWRYMAWVDADILFSRPDWVEETIHQLQHFHVVQMFSEAIDLTPKFDLFQRHMGFMKCYADGVVFDKNYTAGYEKVAMGPRVNMWHPGFAWAMRREAFDILGGLIDFGILGAGDNHMARALVGKVRHSYHHDITPGYRKMLHEWQDRAEKYIRRNVGYVDGVILHNWHGKKKDRRYRDRWKILVDNKYNPRNDIKRDWQGLYQLVDDGTPRFIELRDNIRSYFRARNEDSIDA